MVVAILCCCCCGARYRVVLLLPLRMHTHTHMHTHICTHTVVVPCFYLPGNDPTHILIINKHHAWSLTTPTNSSILVMHTYYTQVLLQVLYYGTNTTTTMKAHKNTTHIWCCVLISFVVPFCCCYVTTTTTTTSTCTCVVQYLLSLRVNAVVVIVAVVVNWSCSCCLLLLLFTCLHTLVAICVVPLTLQHAVVAWTVSGLRQSMIMIVNQLFLSGWLLTHTHTQTHTHTHVTVYIHTTHTIAVCSWWYLVYIYVLCAGRWVWWSNNKTVLKAVCVHTSLTLSRSQVSQSMWRYCCAYAVVQGKEHKLVTTTTNPRYTILSNGCLGSQIDEERSEMW